MFSQALSVFHLLLGPLYLNIGVFNVVPEVSETVLISFHSFFFILFHGSEFHHSVFQVTYLSSASVILLLFPSNVFFISVIVLFISVCLFFNCSRSLLHLLDLCIHFFFPRSWMIFTIIILNSFSGRLPVSTSFSRFSGVLSYSFIWYIVLYLFSLSMFL